MASTFIGSQIEVISISEIRYTGKVIQVDTVNTTVTLQGGCAGI